MQPFSSSAAKPFELADLLVAGLLWGRSLELGMIFSLDFQWVILYEYY
jgi:hypothetical protein